MALAVAITAAEAHTALAPDLAGTVARWARGDTALAQIVGFESAPLSAATAAQIWREPEGPEDDPALRILGAHGRLLDGLALAVHDAASAGGLPREAIGLFVGMGMVDSPAEELVPAVLASREGQGPLDLAAFYAGGYRAIHPLWPLSMLNNVAVGQVAMDLDVRGDNLVVASDAVAGVRALLEGARAVAAGSAAAVIAAGLSERVSAASLARHALRGRPATDCPPGEGGAAFLFETAAGAAARSQRPLGFVRGGATTYGGRPDGVGPAPETVARAAVTALCEAGRAGEDVDLVFLPGEARAAEDRALAAALRALEPPIAPAAVFVRSRTAVGNLLAGGPAVDVVLGLACLGGGIVPPSLDDPGIVCADPAACRPRCVLVLAAGSHGGAGALVLEAGE